MKKFWILPLFIILISCDNNQPIKELLPYGVFIGFDGNLSTLSNYETVVIDAQYFSKENILEFKKDGHKVYTYLNVGSLEKFRPYYNEFEHLTLDVYKHWEEEKWIDVSAYEWQNFVVNILAPELLNKGIDGFFVDNCDVYFQYPNDEILHGLSTIMKHLKKSGAEVIINGGDSFLNTYTSKGGNWKDVITGINQESVFSSIEWNTDSFGKASEEDHQYFTDYIERYGKLGAEIYLLEYTTDVELISEIQNYCRKMGFEYYISDSIDLVPGTFSKVPGTNKSFSNHAVPVSIMHVFV